MSKFRDSLASGKFTFTGEIGPPKGTNVEPVLEEAVHYLKDCCVAVNVTDIQTAVMRMSSLAACRMLVEHGVEPVLQMVTRDRNRLALQSDLLSAYVLGIRNVLALTGDHPMMGDHPGCKRLCRPGGSSSPARSARPRAPTSPPSCTRPSGTSRAS